jgi:imidazolonepropionase-like amidohydrolase
LTLTVIRAPAGWLGPGRLVEDVSVSMEGGRIGFAGTWTGWTSDPASARSDIEEIYVDGFLMPGVVDRHVHIGLSDPVSIVTAGVTAVRDLAWPPEVIFRLVEASESPAFNGPLVRAAGAIITAAGGYPTRAEWAPLGTGVEVRGAEDAAATARKLLDQGAVVLKVALNSEAGPTLSDEELVAVCDVAHEAETIVTAHVQGPGQAARALGAGVDEFAHCPWSERLADDLIHAVAKRMRIVSTLDIHSYGLDTPELRTATDNLARFLAAGGKVAYGTDLGNGPIPAGIHAAEAWHLLGAGLTHERILEAMTFRPLATDEPADLVALGGNPLEGLNALSDVRLVFHAGRRFR